MRANPTRRTRHAAGLLAGGLLLAPLAACSEATTDQRTADDAPLTTSLDEALPSEVDLQDAGFTCENDSCSITLPTGGEAEVLGTTLAFTGSADGTATVQIGDAEATCLEGDTVMAGPLEMECTEVSDDSLTLTAALQ